MHQLELHEVLLEVGHGIAQFCEPILEALERVARGRCATAALDAVA
jgi:hypothetical protein